MMVEWDPAKNQANQHKHGIRFEDAQRVFQDPDRIDFLDDREYDEERWVAIGSIGRLLVYVVYTERVGGVRIISARKADRDDEADYFANKLWRRSPER